jgi:hypothetical protein
VFAPSLTSTCSEVYAYGTMTIGFTEGLIYLIAKTENASNDVRKWKPIMLLNTIYRILEKTIALRLQPFMQSLVYIS